MPGPIRVRRDLTHGPFSVSIRSQILVGERQAGGVVCGSKHHVSGPSGSNSTRDLRTSSASRRKRQYVLYIDGILADMGATLQAGVVHLWL